MDIATVKERVTSLLHRYRYGILIIAIGFVLMSIPGKEDVSRNDQLSVDVPTGDDTQTELKNILSQIKGVGRVEVMLTIAAGEQTIYECDQDSSSGELSDSVRTDTVIITNENRVQQGLIQQIISPVYQGAIVVCQGGDQPSVQLAVVEAVSDVTGLTADKITVLKMK